MSEKVSDVTKRTLKEIGLTDYESRAYTELLQVGATAASQISKNANIPYSKIYEVLNSLENKGWIETSTGRPRTYYPKPPSEAIEATWLTLKDKIESWKKTVVNELQPLYEKREIREKPEVWILRRI